MNEDGEVANSTDGVVLSGLNRTFHSRGVLFGIAMLLRLKPGHTCDAISVATELMLDGAEIETPPYVIDPSARLSGTAVGHSLTVYLCAQLTSAL
jgi:hypothetical protein